MHFVVWKRHSCALVGPPCTMLDDEYPAAPLCQPARDLVFTRQMPGYLPGTLYPTLGSIFVRNRSELDLIIAVSYLCWGISKNSKCDPIPG